MCIRDSGCTLLLGMTIGLVSGYLGGWIDQLIQAVVNIFQGIPSAAFVVAILGLLGPGMRSLLIAIVVSSWAGFSRIAVSYTHLLQPPCGQSTPAAHSGLWTGQKLRPWKPRPQGGEKEGICQQDIGRRPSGQLRRIAKQKRICGEKGPVKLL